MSSNSERGSDLRTLFRDSKALLRGSRRLRRSLLRWLGVGLLTSVASCVGLAALHGDGLLAVGLAGVAWWAFVSVFMVGGAPLLVDPGGNRVNYYGIPNGLSAIRAWSCLPVLLAASLSLPGNLSLLLWVGVGGATAALDFVDGFIARRFGPITEMGQAFDPATDAVFFSMAAIGGVEVGIIPSWLTGVILLRYLGPLLATPVVLLMHRRPKLVYTVWGRYNTELVCAAVFALIVVRYLDGPTGAVAAVLGLGTIVPTMLLHFWSLFQRARAAPQVL